MGGRGHAASEGSSETALRHDDREGGAPSAASASPARREKNKEKKRKKEKKEKRKKKLLGAEGGTFPGGRLVTRAGTEASKSVLHGVRALT